jgi:hypothetical protein
VEVVVVLVLQAAPQVFWKQLTSDVYAWSLLHVADGLDELAHVVQVLSLPHATS